MVNRQKKKFLEIGIALNILAVSISIILKEILQNDSPIITNVLLSISIVLIVDWDSIFSCIWIKKSINIGIVLFLQIYIIFSALFVGTTLFNSNAALIYTIYVIVFLFALMTNHNTCLNEEFFMRLVLVVAAILNVVAFVLIVGKERNFDRLDQNVINMAGGAERSTLSGIPFFFIIAFMADFQKVKKNKIWWIFLIISLINMFACNRRTVYVSVIMCLIIAIIKNNVIINKKKIYNIFFATIIVLIIFHIIMSIKWINDLLQFSVDSLNTGLKTFFSNEYGDASVLIRNRNRRLAIDCFNSNSIIQWIFGRGYAFMWIDFPILEAFLDLGILSGSIYLYLFVFFPIKSIIKINKPSRMQMFMIFYMVASVASSFSSGMPYGYTKYCPLIIFIFVIEHMRRNVLSDIKN